MSHASVDQVRNINIAVELYKKIINKNKAANEKEINDIKNFLVLKISWIVLFFTLSELNSPRLSINEIIGILNLFANFINRIVFLYPSGRIIPKFITVDDTVLSTETELMTKWDR